jgi:hypothetical protein
MGTTTRQWNDLRDRVRTEIRDTGASPVFSDTELADYLRTALAVYSRRIPREVRGTLSLVADQAEYDLPVGCIRIAKIKVGTTPYTASDVYGGKFSVTPTPSANATADIRYTAAHPMPAQETSTLTYDDLDEDIIVKLIRAEVCQTLAQERAKYYKYVEGDVEEDQGKTQSQFQQEADELRADAQSEMAQSIGLRKTGKAQGAGVTRARVASKAKPKRSTTIYREYST